MNTLGAILVAIYAMTLIGAAVMIAPSCGAPATSDPLFIGHMFLGGCHLGGAQ